MAKEATAVAIDLETKMVKDNTVEKTKNQLISGLNINDIVKKAQSLYDKNDKGLSKQLSTGNTIVRPHKDQDFVIWENGTFWKELTGLKGLPFGKISQCSGQSNSGKSSLASQFMAFAQKQGHFVILLDTEQKFQVQRYDEFLGGKSENLLIVDTNSIIDGTKGVAYLVKTIKDQSADAKILIVFDSIGAALNASETNDTDEDMSRQPGAAAKEITWCIKKFARLINQYQNRETGEHTIAVLAINQVYAKIGFMMSGFQEKGGAGLEYMSSLIVSLNRKKDLTRVKGGKKVKYGIISRAKVKKNHLATGVDCLAETEIVVSASGIDLAENIKKKEKDIEGWDQSDDGDE